MLWTTNVEKYSIGTELSASASRSTTSAAPMKNICGPAHWIAARKGRPSIEISARTPALPEKTRSFRGFAEPNVSPAKGPQTSAAALATSYEHAAVAASTDEMLPSESAETMLDEKASGCTACTSRRGKRALRDVASEAGRVSLPDHCFITAGFTTRHASEPAIPESKAPA